MKEKIENTRKLSNLMEASERGDVDLVGELINKEKLDFRLSDEKGNTCLFYAVHNLRIECAIRIIQFGFQPLQFVNKEGNVVHLIAKTVALSEKDHSSKLQKLLDLVVCISPKILESNDREGRKPLHIAVQSRNLFMVKLLLLYNSDPNCLDKNLRTPLFSCLSLPSQPPLPNCFEIAKELVKYGGDPYKSDIHGETVMQLVQENDPTYSLFYLTPFSSPTRKPNPLSKSNPSNPSLLISPKQEGLLLLDSILLHNLENPNQSRGEGIKKNEKVKEEEANLREKAWEGESGKVGESEKVSESGKVGESEKVSESGKVGESEKVSESGKVGESESGKVGESKKAENKLKIAIPLNQMSEKKGGSKVRGGVKSARTKSDLSFKLTNEKRELKIKRSPRKKSLKMKPKRKHDEELGGEKKEGEKKVVEKKSERKVGRKRKPLSLIFQNSPPSPSSENSPTLPDEWSLPRKVLFLRSNIPNHFTLFPQLRFTLFQSTQTTQSTKLIQSPQIQHREETPSNYSVLLLDCELLSPKPFNFLAQFVENYLNEKSLQISYQELTQTCLQTISRHFSAKKGTQIILSNSKGEAIEKFFEVEGLQALNSLQALQLSNNFSFLSSPLEQLARQMKSQILLMYSPSLTQQNCFQVSPFATFLPFPTNSKNFSVRIQKLEEFLSQTSSSFQSRVALFSPSSFACEKNKTREILEMLKKYNFRVFVDFSSLENVNLIQLDSLSFSAAFFSPSSSNLGSPNFPSFLFLNSNDKNNDNKNNDNKNNELASSFRPTVEDYFKLALSCELREWVGEEEVRDMETRNNKLLFQFLTKIPQQIEIFGSASEEERRFPFVCFSMKCVEKVQSSQSKAISFLSEFFGVKCSLIQLRKKEKGEELRKEKKGEQLKEGKRENCVLREYCAVRLNYLFSTKEVSFVCFAIKSISTFAPLLILLEESNSNKHKSSNNSFPLLKFNLEEAILSSNSSLSNSLFELRREGEREEKLKQTEKQFIHFVSHQISLHSIKEIVGTVGSEEDIFELEEKLKPIFSQFLSFRETQSTLDSFDLPVLVEKVENCITSFSKERNIVFSLQKLRTLLSKIFGLSVK